MILFARIGVMMPGRFAEGSAFIRDRAAYIKNNYGVNVDTYAQFGGPTGRIALMSTHESVAELEDIRRKIIADPEAAKMATAAEGNFVPGQTIDAIWLKL